jgi:hypothetical protein
MYKNMSPEGEYLVGFEKSSPVTGGDEADDEVSLAVIRDITLDDSKSKMTDGMALGVGRVIEEFADKVLLPGVLNAVRTRIGDLLQQNPTQPAIARHYERMLEEFAQVEAIIMGMRRQVVEALVERHAMEAHRGFEASANLAIQGKKMTDDIVAMVAFVQKRVADEYKRLDAEQRQLDAELVVREAIHSVMPELIAAA